MFLLTFSFYVPVLCTHNSARNIRTNLSCYRLELTDEIRGALYVAMGPVRIVKGLKRMNEIHVVGGSAQAVIHVALQALPGVRVAIAVFHSEK